MMGLIEIFFSYAHEDEELMDDVRRQLIIDERNGQIIKWHDRKIPPGENWNKQIDTHLEDADIILLFISPDFIESRYCYEIEGQRALQRYEAGEAKLIPVILRPCRWESSPFGEIQALPLDGKPVSQWADRDEACLNIANGVMKVVEDLIKNQVYELISEEDGESVFNKSNLQKTPRLESKYKKIEKLMPKLLAEMRKDLSRNPTTREFVLLKRGWIYNSQGPYLVYYLDEHDNLEGKMRILENIGFIREITFNNVRRFVFEEIFVDYLSNIYSL